MKKKKNNLCFYRDILNLSKKQIYSSRPNKSLGLKVTKNLTLTARETRNYNKNWK